MVALSVYNNFSHPLAIVTTTSAYDQCWHKVTKQHLINAAFSSIEQTRCALSQTLTLKCTTFSQDWMPSICWRVPHSPWVRPYSNGTPCTTVLSPSHLSHRLIRSPLSTCHHRPTLPTDPLLTHPQRTAMIHRLIQPSFRGK